MGDYSGGVGFVFVIGFGYVLGVYVCCLLFIVGLLMLMLICLLRLIVLIRLRILIDDFVGLGVLFGDFTVVLFTGGDCLCFACWFRLIFVLFMYVVCFVWLCDLFIIVLIICFVYLLC